MSLHALPSPNADKAAALEAVDRLRADIESGKLKFFSAVGVGADHGTYCYQGIVHRTTRLEAFGAVTMLLHAHLHGECDGIQS